MDTKVAPDAVAESAPQQYRFSFTGSGREYFSIWIVNLLLSIVTLGIYSAWAKVRREQYFHRNTLLDNHTFDYTGKPVQILIGRCIALVVLGVGSVLQNLTVVLAAGVGILFAIIYPWVMVKSMKFRARNTRYRNIAFNFTGSTFEALKVYFWIYLVVMPFAIASIIAMPALENSQGMEPNINPAVMMANASWIFVGMGISLLLFVLLFPVYLCKIKSFTYNHIRYGNTQGVFTGSSASFYKALAHAAAYSLLAVVLAVVIVFLSSFSGMPALAILIFPLFLLPQAAYSVIITNTVYSCTYIGKHHIRSDMKIGAYLKLIFVNLLLMMITLGIAWPWIKVRVAKYRLQHMALYATPGAISTIMSEAQTETSALGEEAGEFLDFDFSL